MERDEDDFLGEEEDEVESDGMIDRQKGRRLIPGCSTVSQSRLEASRVDSIRKLRLMWGCYYRDAWIRMEVSLW